VLLKKPGVLVDGASVDSELQIKFKEAFKGDMSVRKQQALQILLVGDFDPAAMGLDMAGLDAVEA